MARVRGYFEYPDGMTPGQAKDGGLHQNLYDKEKRLSGHATFIPDEEDDEDDEGEYDWPTGPSAPFAGASGHEGESDSRSRERMDPEEMIEALVTLIKFAEWTAPRLRRWWKGQALPFVKSTRARLARTRKDGSSDAPEESATRVGSVPSESARDAMADPEEDRVSMSSEEASARFAAALMARLFSDEQMRILRNARIESEDGSPEASAVEELATRRIREHVRLMLEENPSLLTGESLAHIGKVLESIRVVGGEYSLER